MKKRRWGAAQIMALGFFGVIILGGLILMLPIANANGQCLKFIDALFTSCTCVCVTGLTTVVPALQFSFFGKIILLLLIQIGGWGVIVCAMLFMVLIGKRISVSARVVLQNHFNMDTMTGLVRMLLYVVRATLVVEGAGAVCYGFRFIPEYGPLRGIWYSVFHSVSAFCNAGVDILGDSGFAGFVAEPWMNIVTAILVILGGLGFMVWQDVTGFLKKAVTSGRSFGHLLRELRLHTKIVLTVTVILLVGGTVFFFAAECQNPETLGNFSLPQKWLAAFFQSVTTRTAGFYTISQSGLQEASKLFGCILMFVGGSPVGTAGGVKTVAITVLLLTCWSILKGKKDTECFRRKIAPTVVRTAIAITVVSIVLVLAGAVILSFCEPDIPMIDLLYEVVSATATVGLTADVTPNLHEASKCVVIALMYLGRIGPVTIPLMFAGKVGRKNINRSLPEEHIML